MIMLDDLRARLLAVFPEAKIAVIINSSPCAQHSLALDRTHAPAIAKFLRDEPTLRFDCCSNVTGIDWPEKEIVETVKTASSSPDGTPGKEVEQKIKRVLPGSLEVVYHLYSIALRQGPLVLRLRTENRTDSLALPSLTPIWRSCEFQEREVFDLFGVVFEGHPDLRRILMWDEFTDHPMRKDYVEPDDYEWEPTPHNEVLLKAKNHYPATAPASAVEPGKGVGA